MADNTKLQAAVEFLLDQHLKGEPSSEEAKAKFDAAQAHKDALSQSAEAVSDPAPKAPAAPPVPPIPKVG